MEKQIYIVRHGQTDYNKNNILQGRYVDSSLNDLGKTQANRFYKKFKNVNFDKVYLSSLMRTLQSVDKFIKKKNYHLRNCPI